MMMSTKMFIAMLLVFAFATLTTLAEPLDSTVSSDDPMNYVDSTNVVPVEITTAEAASEAEIATTVLTKEPILTDAPTDSETTTEAETVTTTDVVAPPPGVIISFLWVLLQSTE